MTPEPCIAAIPALADGWRATGLSVLADDTLAIVAARPDLEVRKPGAAGRSTPDPNARIWIFNGDQLIEGPAICLPCDYARVDRFPDERWLVESWWGKTEKNIRIINAQGEELRQLQLGSCINHLKVDDDGAIWVGWFDEGVLGNNDWSVPGLKRPPSCHGLAAFNDEGELLTYVDTHGIIDCYSLNVTDSTVWACTYAGFPILTLSVHEKTKAWATGLSGVRALAVRPPFVLAAGGYGEHCDELALLKVTETTRADTVYKWRLPFKPSGVQLFDGRNGTIHIVQDEVWSRWRIDDFIHQHNARPRRR